MFEVFFNQILLENNSGKVGPVAILKSEATLGFEQNKLNFARGTTDPRY